MEDIVGSASLAAHGGRPRINPHPHPQIRTVSRRSRRSEHPARHPAQNSRHTPEKLENAIIVGSQRLPLPGLPHHQIPLRRHHLHRPILIRHLQISRRDRIPGSRAGETDHLSILSNSIRHRSNSHIRRPAGVVGGDSHRHPVRTRRIIPRPSRSTLRPHHHIHRHRRRRRHRRRSHHPNHFSPPILPHIHQRNRRRSSVSETQRDGPARIVNRQLRPLHHRRLPPDSSRAGYGQVLVVVRRVVAASGQHKRPRRLGAPRRDADSELVAGLVGASILRSSRTRRRQRSPVLRPRQRCRHRRRSGQRGGVPPETGGHPDPLSGGLLQHLRRGNQHIYHRVVVDDSQRTRHRSPRRVRPAQRQPLRPLHAPIISDSQPRNRAAN